MPVKFTSNDRLGLNRKWIRLTLLIFAFLMTVVGLVQIGCLLLKPTGYQNIVKVLGGNYIQQLFFGTVFFLLYTITKRLKPAATN